MNSRFFLQKVFVAGCLFILPFRGWAGEASLTGYGEVRVQPEFVQVTVRVTSECFRGAGAASSANDEIANKVLVIIKEVAQISKGDEVTATGGYVQRYTGYNPQNGQPYCVNSFRKINSIGLKTHDVDGFAETFANLQDRLYALGMETNPSRTEAPVSFLEIGEPIPGLSSARQKSLERQALTLALQDAKEKFESTLSLAGVDKYKIVSYSENAPTPHYGRDESRKVSAPASGEAPVEFASLLVSKYLHVRFEYTGGNLNIPF